MKEQWKTQRQIHSCWNPRRCQPRRRYQLLHQYLNYRVHISILRKCYCRSGRDAREKSIYGSGCIFRWNCHLPVVYRNNILSDHDFYGRRMIVVHCSGWAIFSLRSQYDGHSGHNMYDAYVWLLSITRKRGYMKTSYRY